MTLYQFFLVLKFLAVMGFAGGVVAAFTSDSPATRKRSAHAVASPSLLAIWLSGYALVLLSGVPLFELWIVAALLLSLLANGLLSYAVARDVPQTKIFAWIAVTIVAVVVLMVTKPTWQQVKP